VGGEIFCCDLLSRGFFWGPRHLRGGEPPPPPSQSKDTTPTPPPVEALKPPSKKKKKKQKGNTMSQHLNIPHQADPKNKKKTNPHNHFKRWFFNGGVTAGGKTVYRPDRCVICPGGWEGTGWGEITTWLSSWQSPPPPIKTPPHPPNGKKQKPPPHTSCTIKPPPPPPENQSSSDGGGEKKKRRRLFSRLQEKRTLGEGSHSRRKKGGWRPRASTPPSKHSFFSPPH